jgi:hypothetical protein
MEHGAVESYDKFAELLPAAAASEELTGRSVKK